MMYKHSVSAEHCVCALTWSDRSINVETMQRAVGSLTCCAKREQVRVISSFFSSCHDYLEWMLKLGFILYLPLLLWWLKLKTEELWENFLRSQAKFQVQCKKHNVEDLSIYPFICLPVYMTTNLPVYLSTHLSIYTSINLSIYLSFYYVSICLPGYRYTIYLFIPLSV